MGSGYIIRGYVVATAVMLVANFCWGEGVPTGKVSQYTQWKVACFSVQEANEIAKIEELTDRYRKLADVNTSDNAKTDDEKCKILECLRQTYTRNNNTFLGVVVLSSLKSIDMLDTISGPENRFLKFARLMGGPEESIWAYLKSLDDPGMKGFLYTWYTYEKDIAIASLPKGFKPSLIQQMRKISRKISIQTKDLAPDKKVKFLFHRIENWKSPLEFEACIRLIVDEYEKKPEVVSSHLREAVLNHLKALMLKHVPEESPPPYERAHTILHEVCIIAIAISDKSLIDIVLPMLNSSNAYVAYKYSEVLEWLQQGIKYPIRYDWLKRAYDSRS